ncbi:glycosyltransferase family 4 protein [Nakamurella lactea]|uniref:glycosyltransferase family 4 protein n=1 Tax=Nakamurella lactea TaxID=459515 RepID=UPI00055B5BF0|nr:glycosyltransferase family 1 protein [Nakamurella lactea]
MPVLTVIVEQLLSPVPGGTGRVTKELATAMAAQAPPGWQLRTASAWHSSTAAAVIDGPIGAIRPRRLPAGRRALSVLWERGLPPAVAGDVVLAPTPLFPSGPPLPPARRGQRRLVIVHDAVPYTHPETLTPRGVGWHRRMIERAAGSARIIVPAQAVASELADYVSLARPPAVVGWGVGDDLAPPADAVARRRRLGLPERYLVFVGTVEPRKGLDLLFAALGAPGGSGDGSDDGAEDNPVRSVPVAIVGPAGWGTGLDQLVAASGLAKQRVLALGRLDDADLAATVTGAAALVAPSRSEGFGLPVLEAMALGVPVLHTAVPALTELTDGAAAVVANEDPAALAAALATLLADPGARARLAEAGRRRAAAFSWQKAAERTWQLVRDPG